MCRRHFKHPFIDEFEGYLDRMLKDKLDPLLLQQLKLNSWLHKEQGQVRGDLSALEKRLAALEKAQQEKVVCFV